MKHHRKDASRRSKHHQYEKENPFTNRFIVLRMILRSRKQLEEDSHTLSSSSTSHDQISSSENHIKPRKRKCSSQATESTNNGESNLVEKRTRKVKIPQAETEKTLPMRVTRSNALKQEKSAYRKEEESRDETLFHCISERVGKKSSSKISSFSLRSKSKKVPKDDLDTIKSNTSFRDESTTCDEVKNKRPKSAPVASSTDKIMMSCETASSEKVVIPPKKRTSKRTWKKEREEIRNAVIKSASKLSSNRRSQRLRSTSKQEQLSEKKSHKVSRPRESNMLSKEQKKRVEKLLKEFDRKGKVKKSLTTLIHQKKNKQSTEKFSIFNESYYAPATPKQRSRSRKHIRMILQTLEEYGDGSTLVDVIDYSKEIYLSTQHCTLLVLHALKEAIKSKKVVPFTDLFVREECFDEFLQEEKEKEKERKTTLRNSKHNTIKKIAFKPIHTASKRKFNIKR